MSLTTVLNSSLVKKRFREAFVKPVFNLKGELLAPPLTKNYTLVGIAFDYLVRFWLELTNSGKVELREWVAEGGYNRIMASIRACHEALSEVHATGKRFALTQNENDDQPIEKNKHLFPGYTVGEVKAFRKVMKLKFEKAVKDYRSYQKTGKLLDDLIQSSLFLARLDLNIRANIVDLKIIEVEDTEDIKDLRKLIAVWEAAQFQIKDKAFLNPTFGKGSELVGGADADLIADDTLIDFKVIKDLKLKEEDFHQLLGYYFLSVIGGINKSSDLHPIQKIGLYFARYGKFWIVPVSEFVSESEITNSIKLFQNT